MVACIIEDDGRTGSCHGVDGIAEYGVQAAFAAVWTHCSGVADLAGVVCHDEALGALCLAHGGSRPYRIGGRLRSAVDALAGPRIVLARGAGR